MNYKHILFATDLSDNCSLAAKKVREIANRTQSSLDIIHVIENAPAAYGGEFSVPIDLNLEQAIETAAREKLSKQAQELDIPPQHQHIEMGSVKHCVLELAKKLNTDLIVVGTHGHHGLEALLGSRANAILHTAKCDVLAVRAQK